MERSLKPDPTDPNPTPTVTPTGWGSYLAWLIVGGCVAVLVKILAEATIAGAPVPDGTVIILLGLAVVTTGMWWLARQRLQRRRERVEPRLATLWLATGKTAGVGGAFCFGAFAVYALLSLPQWQAEMGRARVIHSVLATFGAATLFFAGRALESACRIPDEQNSDDKL